MRKASLAREKQWNISSCKDFFDDVLQVTGSNKGIGFAIVRGLCKQFNGDVYLTGELC